MVLSKLKKNREERIEITTRIHVMPFMLRRGLSASSLLASSSSLSLVVDSESDESEPDFCFSVKAGTSPDFAASSVIGLANIES